MMKNEGCPGTHTQKDLVLFKYLSSKASVNKTGNNARGGNLQRKMAIFYLPLNLKIFGTNLENSSKIFFSTSCKLNIRSECPHFEYKHKCKNIKLSVSKKIIFLVQLVSYKGSMSPITLFILICDPCVGVPMA